MSKLTDKQEAFVQVLIRGTGRRDAYRAAYDTRHMKDETIDKKAARLLADGRVRARYEELAELERQECEKRAVASATAVLEELSNVGLGTKEYPAYDAKGNETGRKPPSMTERLKALELLGKHHRLFTDQGGGTGTPPVRIVDDVDG